MKLYTSKEWDGDPEHGLLIWWPMHSRPRDDGEGYEHCLLIIPRPRKPAIADELSALIGGTK